MIDYAGRKVLDGFGRKIMKNGTYEIGFFKREKLDGKGTRYNDEGEAVESGTFANGNFLHRQLTEKQMEEAEKAMDLLASKRYEK